jgi:hypothetical protein
VKIVLVLGMLGMRLLRSSKKGPELARWAAEAIGQEDLERIERLELAWTTSGRLLMLEVILAIPVVLLGVVIGR